MAVFVASFILRGNGWPSNKNEKNKKKEKKIEKKHRVTSCAAALPRKRAQGLGG